MKKKAFHWSLVLLWMGLIFFFSHQPATESSELSSGITRRVYEIIITINSNTSLDQATTSFVIRKGAHFGVYLVLGLLVSNGLIYSNISKSKVFYLALFICVLYAASDEIHQLYVPGKSGQVSDVLLDSAGALVGILLINAVRRMKS